MHSSKFHFFQSFRRSQIVKKNNERNFSFFFNLKNEKLNQNEIFREKLFLDDFFDNFY